MTSKQAKIISDEFEKQYRSEYAVDSYSNISENLKSLRSQYLVWQRVSLALKEIEEG